MSSEATWSRQGRALERLLEQHGAELLACKRRLRDELPAMGAEVRDEIDNSADHLARAVGVALLEVCSASVREIDGALLRLQRGAYGTCAACACRIPAARLKVVPSAERCLSCQRECDASALDVVAR